MECVLFTKDKVLYPRVGTGYDIHAFGPGDGFVLGGIFIPHAQGIVAYSDGDVLLHALIDALLGSCSLGDIGTYFPDTDEDYRNADSADLLTQVLDKVKEAGFCIHNIDTTLVCHLPRLSPYIDEIRDNLSILLAVERGQISIKAKSANRLGDIGKGLGIWAICTVLVVPITLKT